MPVLLTKILSFNSCKSGLLRFALATCGPVSLASSSFFFFVVLNFLINFETLNLNLSKFVTSFLWPWCD